MLSLADSHIPLLSHKVLPLRYILANERPRFRDTVVISRIHIVDYRSRNVLINTSRTPNRSLVYENNLPDLIPPFQYSGFIERLGFAVMESSAPHWQQSDFDILMLLVLPLKHYRFSERFKYCGVGIVNISPAMLCSRYTKAEDTAT
jgi:hypothetical protein